MVLCVGSDKRGREPKPEAALKAEIAATTPIGSRVVKGPAVRARRGEAHRDLAARTGAHLVGRVPDAVDGASDLDRRRVAERLAASRAICRAR